jgi:hypothetical protein
MEFSRATGKTFVVIDGLDKCDPLDSLLLCLVKLAEELHVFVTSRNHLNIQRHFKDQTHYTISADDIGHDVQQFVEMEVKTNRIRPDAVDVIVGNLTSGGKRT